MEALFAPSCPCAPRPDDAEKECRRLRQLLDVYQNFVGHDLANQLVSIQAYSRMLGEMDPAALEPEIALVVGRLTELGRRVAEQTRRLAEMGRLLREPAWGPPQSVHEAGREAVAALRTGRALAADPLGAREIAALSFHIDPDLPALPVNPTLLRHVLIDMLNHAVASVEPAGSGTVEIRADWRGGEGTLQVCHTSGRRAERPDGPPDGRASGAPPADLALTRQAAALWGGQVVISADENQMTTVTVFLCAGDGGKA